MPENIQNLNLSKIQLKRGPSTKLDKVTKYDYEPIVLIDLEELIIWRGNQKPIRFQSYSGFIQLDQREEDFEGDDVIGKIWCDVTGSIKYGGRRNGKFQAIKLDDLIDQTILDQEIKNITNKLDQEIENITNKLDQKIENIINNIESGDIVAKEAESAKKLAPGAKILLKSSDLTSSVTENFTGDKDYTINVDLSPHKNTKASSTVSGHIKLGDDFKMNSSGQIILDDNNFKEKISTVAIDLIIALGGD